jgi:Family of unknown function (DUF5681)
MSEADDGRYKVGYGKPPREHSFKKGICPNPKGRPRRREPLLGDLVDRALHSETEYLEQGRRYSASRLRVTIMYHIAKALKGDVGSADILLILRDHAYKHGDTGSNIRINVIGGMPQIKGKNHDK